MLLRLAAACALFLLAFVSSAEARQKHQRATGLDPSCNITMPCVASMSTAEVTETVRVARGKHIAHEIGIGGVVPRRHVRKVSHASRRGVRATVSVAGSSGIIHAASGAVAHVAAQAAGAFQCLVDKLDAQGYPVKFMGGWRAHGSVHGSLHPAGLALDVNQLRRNVTQPAMPHNEIALANSCGLVSGAQWADSDSGHFQLNGWAGQRRQTNRYASSTLFR